MKVNLKEKTSQIFCVFLGMLGIAGLIIYYALLKFSNNNCLGYFSIVNKFSLEIKAVIILFNVISLISIFIRNRKLQTKQVKLKHFFLSMLQIAIGSYVILCLFIYFNQDELINKYNLIFHPTTVYHKYSSDNVEEISITVPDNIKLQGWLVKNSSKNKSPLIIFFGGSGRDVSEMLDYLKFLDGYTVACFNYRGFGFSEGSANQDNCLNDAKLIYDTLSKRDDIDSKEIITMGWSLGTFVSVYLSDNRPIKGTILVSPLEDMSSRLQHYAPLIPLSIIMKQSFNSISRASNINCPLLCLIGDKDVNVSPNSSMNLVKKWKGMSNVKIYKGDDHGLLFESNNSWQDIQNFLKSLE